MRGSQKHQNLPNQNKKKRGLTIEFGSLGDLNLADEDVLQGVDSLAFLFDSLSNGLRDEFGDEILEFASGSLRSHNLHHFSSDGSDLGGLSVGGLADLVVSSLGEGNGEHSKDVAVKGLDFDVRFDEALPLSDEGAKFVSREVHAVEVGQAVLALNVLDSQPHLSVGLVFILLKVRQVHFKNSSLQIVRSDSYNEKKERGNGW
jgi:hypothetical protein